MVGYKLGDKIDFKLKAGRGRPSMGTIIEDRGNTVLIENSYGKRIEIPEESIIGKHVTRYTPRQRRLL